MINLNNAYFEPLTTIDTSSPSFTSGSPSGGNAIPGIIRLAPPVNLEITISNVGIFGNISGNFHKI